MSNLRRGSIFQLKSNCAVSIFSDAIRVSSSGSRSVQFRYREVCRMKYLLLAMGMVACLAFVSSAQAAGDPAAGKAKAAPCAPCHGANGQGVAPNPPLAGMAEDKFVQAMQDYKSGKRVNP